MNFVRRRPSASGKSGQHLQIVDGVPPQKTPLVLGECFEPVVGEHLVKSLTMSIVERHRRWRALAVIHDQFERSATEFIGEARPITLDAVPVADRGKGRPHARMPVKNRAPGVEAQRLDVGCVHEILTPSDKHAIRERPLISRCPPSVPGENLPDAPAAILAIHREKSPPPAYRNWSKSRRLSPALPIMV